MRYYNFTLVTNAERISENTSINLGEYAYRCSIGAVNNYMYKSMKNGVTFIMYREETENTVLATFSYDERKYVYKEVYHYILDILNNVFCIKKVRREPCEITMFQFREYLNEGKRRGFIDFWSRLWESANLFIYDYDIKQPKAYGYDFEETIILDDKKKASFMYDNSLKQELENIEKHGNCSEIKGNMVHYIISGRSVEAICDMTEVLVQSLLRANRIKSRRIEIINNIEPEVYARNNHLEDIIENNYGGTIVFDLTEKFGHDPVDYILTCKYIENLVKKYRNECLFIFTYNMENPGFSYHILPKLSKYIIPIVLREGKGDRRTAINYMKYLIKNSDYSMYAQQAGTYFKQFPGKSFTQTEVMEAYERFEAWCLNKNILQAYDYDLSDDFMLDRDINEDSSYVQLQKIIGLETVKKQIEEVIATNMVEKERKSRQSKSYKAGTMHMIFGGNPGSAKTTVAKLFAGIAKEKGILKSGAFVEQGGMDLDGMGCVNSIREAFIAAKGGVLFIDEAYSLKSDTAVTVLIQEMENHREDVIVILAGYNERMKSFMEINEGLKSRVPYWIEFPDYDADELIEIFKLMVKEKGLMVTEDAIEEAHYIFDKVRFQDNFGNGRYVRNLIEHAIQKQSVRLIANRECTENIKNRELFLITKDDICILEDGLKDERVPGTAQRELEDMIGLCKVKEIIQKAVANYKVKKLCMSKGILKDKASLHMVFTGNPGSAKTTVARLFSEIMKDEKILSTGTFVEVGRADLVGDHVGATAPLVKRKFKEAQGGVLFIDEAYSLCDSYENGFGDEAINTIVQEMENHRDNVIVIFAGYPAQMKQFLDRNPGLLSRIAFQVDFEDYTVTELCEITKLMLSRKQMSITDEAMEKLRMHYENAIGSDDFGNGRFVRKMIEEAEMNLAERMLRLREEELTVELITTLEESDIPELNAKQYNKKNPMGFHN